MVFARALSKNWSLVVAVGADYFQIHAQKVTGRNQKTLSRSYQLRCDCIEKGLSMRATRAGWMCDMVVVSDGVLFLWRRQ